MLHLVYESATSNNGMHPTADTLPVMLREWLGAAGDAGREAIAEGAGRRSFVKARRGKDYLR